MSADREQSYYYQRTIKDKKRSPFFTMPRFLRRFYHQYPKLVLGGVIVAIASVYVHPIFEMTYRYYTMPPNQYEAWKAEEHRKAIRRARYGEGFVLPFTNRTFDLATPDEIRLSELREVQRKKMYRRDLNKLGNFLGMTPDIEVTDDD